MAKDKQEQEYLVYTDNFAKFYQNPVCCVAAIKVY